MEGYLDSHIQVQHGVVQGDLKDPPVLAQYLPDLLPADSMQHIFTGGGMPTEGHEPERTTSPLHALSYAVHASGPGGG